MKVQEEEEEEEPVQDVTITGRSSTSLIVRYKAKKRHLTCSSTQLLNELSEKLPAKKRIRIENNVITNIEK